VAGPCVRGKGEFFRSIAILQKGFDASKAPMFLGSLGYAYARAGERDKAMSAIRDLRALAAEGRYFSDVNVAIVYAGLGDANGTFAWLNKACVARDGRVQQLVWPMFDQFRRDPRYLELKGRIGLR
jgi:Flp pilus assembly protein TadD